MSTPAEYDELMKKMYIEGDALIDQIREANAPRVFIISGPSGVGKDTVIDRLRILFPNAKYVVTATTRPMRSNEQDGLHYQFMTKEAFEQGIDEGGFIENEEVYGNHYGVPRRPIEEGLAEDRDVIIKVDVKGAATLRDKITNTISIFLVPESMDALHRRLQDRKTDDPDALMKRFGTASKELMRVDEFDYVVFNEDAQQDAAVNAIVDIVNTERLKVKRPEITLP